MKFLDAIRAAKRLKKEFNDQRVEVVSVNNEDWGILIYSADILTDIPQKIEIVELT